MNRTTQEPFSLRVLDALRRRIINRARLKVLMREEPRRWSNRCLRVIGPAFEGSILNVSGWRDEDKEGGLYRDYFPNADTYSISNYKGTDGIDDGIEGAIHLDLQQPLPPDRVGSCDYVFTHTVLEHIGDLRQAAENLAGLARKGIITVVPFLQQEHRQTEIYGDYWRFAPMGLDALFRPHGFTQVFLDGNNSIWYPIYICGVALREPDSLEGKLPENPWDPAKRFGRQQLMWTGAVN